MIKILLDTNIIVYKESDNTYKDNIGVLYRIIDNNYEMIKFIHPIIKKEILQNIYDNKRQILMVRLKSYNMLDNPSKNVCDEIKNKFLKINKTINDEYDDILLNEVYLGKVDILITEDKKLKKKALALGIEKKVMNINEFIFSNNDVKKVKHDILSINKVKMGTLNINDKFFDDLKKSYPNFEEWFSRKSEEEAYCYFEKNNLLGLLFLKNEEIGDDNYDDIKPNMRINRKLKISTFKVDIPHKKIGERFMKIIFDQAIYSMVDEIYVTLFDNDDKKRNLIRYFEKFGFLYFGKKNEKELVYIRSMKKHFCNEFPLKTYPFIDKSNDTFIIPIKPKYHIYLLPDSKLLKENYKDVHMPVEYAINKYYVSAAGFLEKPKIGDNIVFYRTKQEFIPAKYSSAITTIGLVTNIFNPSSIDELVNKVKKRTVYSDSEIISYYSSKIKNTYIIEFAYITTLTNKLNLEICLNNNILQEAPRSVIKISNEQFKKILELGEVDNSILI